MEIETHPFEPWLPSNAKLLLLGAFLSTPKCWCMEWYYPNYTNDIWRIFGHVPFGDKQYFVNEEKKTYKPDLFKPFLKEKGIAIFDTVLRIYRITGTASDKDLEIIERVDLGEMLRSLSGCKAVLATGQSAITVFTEHHGIDARKMKMGGRKEFNFEDRTLYLYREPSSSRAHPMKVEKKAEHYERMFRDLGILG